jgi:hypothetical protein
MPNPIITERSVVGMFFNRLAQSTGSGWVDAICSAPFSSDQDSEQYGWLGMVPQLAPRKGEKRYQELGTYDWTIRNAEYQNGIRIPKKHLLYDKTDQVQVRVNDLADRARAHWAALVAPLLLSAASTACYDGQYFFDTDHSEGASGAQSNSISVDISALAASVHGSVTAPSAAEMVGAIMAGIEQMLGFRDDQGEYVNENLTEFLILTGHTLTAEALTALRARSIDGSNTNILVEQDAFRLRVMTSPRLASWTDKFALFAPAGNFPAFLRQQRKPNNGGGGYSSEGLLVQTLWLDSEHCKKNDEVLVSVETERAVGYGDWRKACLVTMV